MSRARSRRWCPQVLAALLLLAWSHPLDAALFTLSEQDRAEAIRVGKRSVIGEEFGAEWRVGGDGPGQNVTVMTPFHRVALAARNSAFKNNELTPTDVDKLLKEHEGKLVLWARLRGSTADFARFYSPVLVAQREEIKPTFTQNERTALREEDGRYSARCVYVFPTEELSPTATVTLIVRDPDEKTVAKFTVHLSAMR